ncbi:hypothetical protein GUJ93_ZPchr0012g18953 [Zizania palustris]|uniref:Uncharacterized protein n=1 Tax=Zizania palustris TaxID=103762 RepID=A0A8J5WT80_ZIZPA|nr:hypothetical protein GUJ93_ZPchr0012g18953 [Zizania palustris]
MRGFWTFGKKQGNFLRKVMRGWGGNLRSQAIQKEGVMHEIKALDDKACLVDLSPLEWEERYSLDRKLGEMYQLEADYWCKRSGQQWLLEGDANTSYFHRVATC